MQMQIPLSSPYVLSSALGPWGVHGVSFTRVGLQVLYHGVLNANDEFDPHESMTFCTTGLDRGFKRK
jgi:hypothetical protein